MIEIPFDVLISLTQEVGAIYYYFSQHLVATQEPHYFVVLAHSDSTIHVVCATSKIDKTRKWAQKSCIPLGTLIEVAPTKENGLKMLSLFNCNDVYEETSESLRSRHEEVQIKVPGKMDAATVLLLKNAVKLSPLVTREKKRLIG